MRNKLTLFGIGLAILYWVVESAIHRFVYTEEFFEIVPSDANELWMRILIIILIIGFGAFADNRASQIRKAEQEKREVFVATVRSTQHILNNLLNQLLLVTLDLDEHHRMEPETLDLLNRSIREGVNLVGRLSSVTEMDSDSIERSVLPQ